jgi:MYXO-CTERM domain-containing protein
MKKFTEIAIPLFVLSVWTSGASAVPTGIEYTQTTLGEELIVGGLEGSGTSDRLTRQFSITNDTGVAWSDYHFRVDSETDPIVIFNEQLSIDEGNLNDFFANVMFSADNTEVWFFDGTIAAGADFDVSLVLWDDGESNGVGPADVYGKPSITIPEPVTAALAIVGLAGLGLFASRRRRRA